LGALIVGFIGLVKLNLISLTLSVMDPAKLNQIREGNSILKRAEGTMVIFQL
jgi:hypothetical protein